MTFVGENWDPEMSSKGYPILTHAKIDPISPQVFIPC